MSRLARKPILIPSDVTVQLDGNLLTISRGDKLSTYQIPVEIALKIDATTIQCEVVLVNKRSAAMLGTTHVNIANLIIGLVTGFNIDLQLVGIGYSVTSDGKVLVFVLGKSHNDFYTIPNDVTIVVPDKTTIKITGINKGRVGEVADEIARFRRPDAYKGKGIRYKNREYKLKEVKK